MMNKFKLISLFFFTLFSFGSELKAQTNEFKAFEKRYKQLKSQYTVLGDVKVNGVLRFTTYYRDMSQVYSDMIGPKKQLSFTQYPLEVSAISTGANRGQPLLELNIEGKPTESSYFKVGYALNHQFLGLNGDSSRFSGIRQYLNFEADKITKIGTWKLQAGGGSNWVSISPLTFSNRRFRIDPFEKVQWDWNSNSPKKYNDMYTRPTVYMNDMRDRTATQGFTLQLADSPSKFGGTFFFGKTSRNGFTPFPDLPFTTIVGRVESMHLKNSVFAINHYNQNGKTTRTSTWKKDAREITTLDYRFENKTEYIRAEIGAGRIINPKTQDNWKLGEGIFVLARSQKLLPFHIESQFYMLDRYFVSQESAAWNSTLEAPAGGVTRTLEFDGNMYVNYLQEAHMATNNRTGGNIRLDKQFGDFHFELNNALSIEQENLYDTITIGHRVNGLSRSRFTPFGSSVGPYQRLRNRFMKSFETLEVLDADSVKDYKKGYNTLDLTAKYRMKFRHTSLIFVNYLYAGSVGEGLKPIPGFTDKSFYRQYYEELSIYYLANPKVVLSVFGGVEKLLGNQRTTLSLESKEINQVAGKAVDQLGTVFGLGLDWDFMRNGGLFLRHKWFNHKDKNFVLDQFVGQETSLEIKVFF